MLLTAELLLHYQRCHRRAFLNVWGDTAQMDPLSDFHLKLLQDRLAHQKTFLAELTYHQPDYPKRDWQTAAQATLALMAQGVERIHKGVLLANSENLTPQPPSLQGKGEPESPSPCKGGVGEGSTSVVNSPTVSSITLLSIPDLLVKQPGKSRFGDWLYVPIDIELGKRAKLEYQILAAFHAQVLGQVQGTMPEKAWLILREKGYFSVNLAIRLPQMLAMLKECHQVVNSQQPPEVFISRQRCNICRWYNYCYGVAKSEEHLSLLPGVTPSRYAHLQQLNLTTLPSLANASLEVLEPTFEREVALQMVRQAQSVLENRVIWISQNLTLPNSAVELYFDIEAEPELDLAYLLGVLVVDYVNKTEKFYPLLAEKPADEELIWHQFLELALNYPEANIYHFCNYEIETVKRLSKLYNTPKDLWQPLLTRFVDIHEKISSTMTLPIENYSLKSIARWMGFEWRNVKANGGMAIYWYDKWLETSDRTFLDLILRYNEDDCRATYHVKNWLTNFSYQINSIDAMDENANLTENNVKTEI